MPVQDGPLIRAWEVARPRLLDAGRRLADLILPPLTHEAPEPRGATGLSADAWSRVTFLEDPVCDGCGAAFEHQGGAFAESRCAACQAQPHAFGRARAACLYDEASRGLILGFKHGDQQQFAPLFARWVERAAQPLIADCDAVVPAPLHPLRLLSRQFNQAAEIARPLARFCQREFLPDALVRRRHTDSQGGKSARGRRLNVRAAFAVTPAGVRRIRGRRLLLVDDVLTTGATADACARALLAAGARSVDLAVVARVRAARSLTT